MWEVRLTNERKSKEK